MSIILMGIHEGKGFAWLIKIPKGLKGILIIFTNKGQHFFFFLWFLKPFVEYWPPKYIIPTNMENVDIRIKSPISQPTN